MTAEVELAAAKQELQDIVDAQQLANQRLDEVRSDLIERIEGLAVERYRMNKAAEAQKTVLLQKIGEIA